MMKEIIIPVIIFAVILTTGIWVLGKRNKSEDVVEAIPTPNIALPTITGDIKVELTAKNNNREVVLKISGIPQNMETVEYELTYITGSGLPRGVLGKIEVDGKTELVRGDIVLGTCSSGKCVYDSGVEKIDLSLKFNSPDGASVYQGSFPL